MSVTDAHDKHSMILDAATAVFSEKGFHDATIDMIADAAHVGKGTVYLYFTCKERILEELIYQALEAQMSEAMDALAIENPVVRLRELLSAGRFFAEKRLDLMRVIMAQSLGAGRTPAFREKMKAFHLQYLSLVVQTVADGQSAGAFRRDIDALTAASLLVSLRTGMIIELVRSRTPDTLTTLIPEGLVDRAMAFVLEGIGSRNA